MARRRLLIVAALAAAASPAAGQALRLSTDVPEPAPIYCALAYRFAFEQIQGQQQMIGHGHMAVMSAVRLVNLVPVLEKLPRGPANEHYKRLLKDPDVEQRLRRVHSSAGRYLRSGSSNDEAALAVELFACDQRYGPGK